MVRINSLKGDTMRNTKGIATKIWLTLLGISLIFLGILLLSTPLINSMVIAFTVCFIIALHGVTQIYYYFSYRKIYQISGWTLADGIVSTLLGIALMLMPKANLIAISLYLAFWVIYAGVNRTTAALISKNIGLNSWWLILIIGVTGILLGFLMLFNPIYNIVAIGYLIPLAFIIQGISATISTWHVSSRE